MCGRRSLILSALFAAAAASAATASDFAARFQEVYASPLTPKRELVFAFTEPPAVRRAGDRIDITFAVKGYCDVTVAIEEQDGRIVRHLASGVLGPNAPAPFQKNSLRQHLVWDGKNDKGEYLDDTDALTVRVSLGLDPRFERTLYWSPYKRFGSGQLLMDADQDGFYVRDENGSETIRHYDHDGNYVRTVYPFPADKIDQVRMPRRTFPDGVSVPAKRGYFLATLLTGRESGAVESSMRISSEATAFTVRSGRMALAGLRVNRMSTDGTSGGLDLWGPNVGGVQPQAKVWFPKQPYRMALSPDHRFLYLTAHTWLQDMGWCPFSEGMWSHCVFRMEFAGDDEPKPFLGHEHTPGSDNTHLSHPADVAVDRAGRIYVADQGNHRVQIFAPDGQHLRTLRVEGPALVRLHHQTQEVYVFSYFLGRDPRGGRGYVSEDIRPTLRIFGAYPDLQPLRSCPLPLRRYGTQTQRNEVTNRHYQVALNTWVDPPRLLMQLDKGGYPELYELQKDGLVLKRNLLDDARKARIPLDVPGYSRQRLFVDHRRNRLYLFDGGKWTSDSVEIDPETGRCQMATIPFGASDMAISPDGVFFLRTGNMVGRYDRDTWREMPFDYGEDRETRWTYNSPPGYLTGGLRLPSTKTNPHWHHGGMDVNARGELVVTCFNPHGLKNIQTRKGQEDKMQEGMEAYAPVLFPGRLTYGREVHVWDDRGRPLYRDILAGAPELTAGIHIDVHGNIYANVAGSVMWEGRPYWKVVGHRFDQVGTLVKFKAGQGRFLKAAGTIVPLDAPPDRPMDLDGFWIEGHEWTYPGVGRTQWGMDCQCWNSRTALDLFARSFAPEYDRFSVAVLDTNGNLITRIGRYGNVEDGVPLIARGGPEHTRSIGGDEVALFDACYVATFTDRRLFIADAGNARILSVKLDYHATQRVALKDVKESG